MAEERVLYRTSVDYHDGWDTTVGTCIVTNSRVIVRWGKGGVDQYPFALISSVEIDKDTRTSFMPFNRKSGVVIRLANGRSVTYETPEARKLASAIQDAMIPF